MRNKREKYIGAKNKFANFDEIILLKAALSEKDHVWWRRLNPKLGRTASAKSIRS